MFCPFINDTCKEEECVCWIHGGIDDDTGMDYYYCVKAVSPSGKYSFFPRPYRRENNNREY